MNNFEQVIKDEFLKRGSRKVKNENVIEYLTSFKRKELMYFIAVPILINDDISNMHEVVCLRNSPKKKIIKYIMKNINTILESYIKIIKTDELKQLKIIIKNNGKRIIFDEMPLSLHCLEFVKTFLLAKVEYNSKDDSLKIFMPKEYIDIFENIFNDKKILKENHFNNEVYNYSRNVVDTYGIITLDKLHELFEKQMFKINRDDLNHIFKCFSIYDEYPMYALDEDNILLCSIMFHTEDEALAFYLKQKMNYRTYNKKIYKEISDGVYVERLKSYKKFINYLCRNYCGISQELEYIRDFIVNDYISFAQISLDDAKRTFKTNIVTLLEITEEEIEEFLVLVNNIFEEYPKWIKKGNV